MVETFANWAKSSLQSGVFYYISGEEQLQPSMASFPYFAALSDPPPIMNKYHKKVIIPYLML